MEHALTRFDLFRAITLDAVRSQAPWYVVEPHYGLEVSISAVLLNGGTLGA